MATDIRVYLDFTDSLGRPVSSVQAGQDFELTAMIEDMRDGATGIAKIYFDLSYDSALASVPDGAGVFHSQDYSITSAGTNDLSVAGQLTAVGGEAATQPDSSFAGDPYHLLSIPLTAEAGAAGQRLVFTPSSAAQSIFYWQDSNPVPFENVEFIGPMGTSDLGIDIVAPGPQVSDFMRYTRAGEAAHFSQKDFAQGFTNLVPGSSLQFVQILELPTIGSLTLGETPVSADQVIPVGQLQNLVYTAGSETFVGDYIVWTASADGTEYAPESATVMILVMESGFDMPPVLSEIHKSVPSGEVLSFTLADFDDAFSDYDLGDSMQAVQILSLPTRGTLKLGASEVTEGQVIEPAVLATLTYQSATDYTGPDSFAWNASDGTEYSFTDSVVSLAVTESGQGTTGPIVTVTPLVTNDSTPTLTGTVTDASSEITGVIVVVGGQNLAAAVTGNTWSVAVPTALTDGVYDVTATATNEAGDTGTDGTNSELTVDTVAPTVTVAALVTNDNTPTLTGTVNDPGPSSGLTQVSVTIGDQTLTAAVIGNTWNVAVPTALAEGVHSVTASATDLAGNTASDATANELTVDTAAPAVTVATVVSTSNRPTLTGTVSDPTPSSGIAGVSVLVGAQTLTAEVTGNTWTVTLPIGLSDGVYDVTAIATDNAGNSTSDTTTGGLTVDTIAPSVTVATLVTSDNTPTLTGTVTDPAPGTGIASVSVVVDGQTLTAEVADNTWSVLVPTALDDGTHNVTVIATDHAGNVATDATSGELTVDTAAPTVSVATLLTTDTTPTLTGTVSDPSPSSGIVSVSVVVGGQTLTATVTGTDWSVAVPTALADGVYAVTATATDAAGNSASDATSNELTVDTTAPLASVTTPDGVGAASGSANTTTVTVTYTDTVSGIDATSLTASNVTVDHGATVTGISASDMANGKAITYTITAPAAASWGASYQGTYTLSLVADQVRDLAGNYAPAVATLATFLVDTTVPTVSDLSKSLYENGSLTFAAEDFEAKFDDPGGQGLAKVKIVTVPHHGTLTLAGSPVSAGDEIPVTQLNYLVYTPLANFNDLDTFEWNGSDGVNYADTEAEVKLDVVDNTVPTVSNVTKSVNLGGTLVFAPGDFTAEFSDAADDDLAKVKIVSLPTQGTLTLSGIAVSIGQEIAAGQLGNLAYTPTSTTYLGGDSFQWNGSDGVHYAATAANVNITIVDNALPTVGAFSKTCAVGASFTFSTSDFVSHFSDPTTGEFLRTVKFTDLPDHGTLKLDGVAVTVDQEIAAVDLWKLTYTDTSGSVDTDILKWNGANSTSYSSASATITISTVADVPTLTAFTKTIATGSTLAFAISDFTSHFSDRNPAHGLQTVQFTDLPDNGKLYLLGTEITSTTQEIAFADLANLTYVNTTAGADIIRWNASDGTSYAGSASTITITAQQDVPVVSAFSKSVAAGTTLTFTVADFTGHFTDYNAAHSLQKVKFTDLPDYGTLKFDGAVVTTSQEFAVADLAKLTYTPTDSTTGSDTIRWTASDGTTYASDVAITISRVADVPVVADFSKDIAFNTSSTNPEVLTFTAADFINHFTDYNASHTVQKVKITQLPTYGTLKLNGTAVTLNQEIASTSLGQLTYQATLNFVGSDTVKWNASDGTNYAAAEATITLNSVPNVPTLSEFTKVVVSGTSPITFSAADFTAGFSAPGGDSLAYVKITQLPIHGTLYLSGEVVTVGQVISVSNLANLTYTPNAGNPTSYYDAFKWNGSGSPYAATDSTAIISVQQDLPTLTAFTKTVLTGQTYTFTYSDFSSRFADLNTAHTLQSVKITLLPTNGTLNYNGTALTSTTIATTTISMSDLNNGLLTYVASSSQSTDTIGWNASDGTNYAASPSTFVVNAVSDVPTVKDFSKSVAQNATLTFAASDFTANFTDLNPSHSLQKVKITDLPDLGTLYLSGAAVTVNQEIAAANLGSLTYVSSSVGSDSFRWTASDGTTYAAADALVSLTVTSSSVAPTLADFAKQVAQDTVLTFTAADFSSHFSSSTGGTLQTVKITALPANGTLKLSGTAVTAGQEIAVSNLANLTYQGNSGYGGGDTFKWNGSDGTNYAAAESTVTITVGRTGAIYGYVCLDANGDGVRGSDELGLAGIVVQLYLKGTDGTFAAASGVAPQMTGADGSFRFERLASGTYKVVQIAQPGDYYTYSSARESGEVAVADSAVSVDLISGQTLRPTMVSQRLFLLSTPAPAQIVRDFNKAPTLDLNGTGSSQSGTDYATTYTAGTAAVYITAVSGSNGGGATVTDPDGGWLAYLTVTMSSRPDGDSEVLAATPSNSNIKASYSSGVLTLSGAATVADYQQAVQSITYRNTSTSPTTGVRTITFSAFDGIAHSNTATVTLTVNGSNGATAPTAAVTTPPPNITASSASASTTTLTVTYTANSSATINTSSFATSNLTVNNGATVTSVSASGNAVTYTIKAPSSTWSASTQGTYTVALVANQVKDSAGFYVAANASLATFTVDTAAPTASVTTVPPTLGATSASASTTTLTVTYSDSGLGLDTSSFSTANLSVTNSATVTGISISGNAVTYTITAPSSTWSASTQGTYTVSLAANQVKDLGGNYVAANSSLTSFLVDTTSPTASVTTAPPSINSSGATGTTTAVTVTYSDAGAGMDTSSYSTSNLTVDHGATITAVSVSGNAVTYTITATTAGTWGASYHGTYTIGLVANQVKDLAGNYAAANSSLATFTVDVTAPVVTVTAPASGSTINDTTPTFSGSAGTLSGDSSTVTVKVYSGSSVDSAYLVRTLTATASSGAYSVEPTSALSSGTYTVQATQTDAAGNTGLSDPVTFTIDTTAPQVTLTSPADGGRTNDTTPTFVGTAGTATGDSSTVTVNLYSGSAVNDANLVETLTATVISGTYSIAGTTVLTAGTYTAQASQTNIAGNTGTSGAVTFTIDLTAPEVTLEAPADGSSTNDTTPTFSGTAGELIGDLLSVTVMIYEGSTVNEDNLRQTLTTTATSGSYSVVPSTALTAGTYTAQAVQSDTAGNTGTSTPVTFTIDTTVPAVTLTNPADDSATNDATPAFSGTAGTAASDSSTVTVRIYSGSTVDEVNLEDTLTATVSGGSYTVSPSTALADGVYTAQASQTDAAGNTGTSDAVTFTVDTTVPAVTLTNPADDSATNDATPAFSGTAGTAASDSSTVTVRIYSGSSVDEDNLEDTLTATVSGGSYTVSPSTALADGVYTAQASQTDAAGNTGTSAAVTFTIDTVAPTATWEEGETEASLINAAESDTNTATVTLTYADSGSGLDASSFSMSNLTVSNGATVTNVSINGNTVAYTITAPQATWADSPQGVYTVNLAANQVRDLAGNYMPATADIAGLFVDTVIPTATLTTPPPAIGADDAAANTTMLTVTYADPDPGWGIDANSLSTSNLTVDHGATVTGISVSGNAVTYVITAPAATWGESYQGAYTVSLVANQVMDQAGNYVAANATLATFEVDTAGAQSAMAGPSVVQNGSQVDVTGTAGDDTLEFIAGTDQHTVIVNGESHTFDAAEVTSFAFDGGGGSDAVQLTGSDGVQTAQIYPTSATYQGPGYSITVANAANIHITAGDGDSEAHLFDSAGDDLLTADGALASLAGDDFVEVVVGFKRVIASATAGGQDRASVADAIDFVLTQEGSWLPL